MRKESIAEKYGNRLLKLKRRYVEELRGEAEPDIRADIYIERYGLYKEACFYSLHGLGDEFGDTYTAILIFGRETEYVEIKHSVVDDEDVWSDERGLMVKNVRLVY